MNRSTKLAVLLGLCLTSLAYGYPQEGELNAESAEAKRSARAKDFGNKVTEKGTALNGYQQDGAMTNGYYNAGSSQGSEPGKIFQGNLPFMVRIAKNNGEPGETTVGRYLSVDDEYLFDWRNSETYRCNFHEGVDYASVWEQEPGQSPDTFYVRMKSNPRNGIAEHRYLAVLEYPPYQNDRRDQDSLWLVVHKDKEEAIEWKAVGSDSRSIYLHAIRNHSKTGGWTTGYSVSARELVANDKRDNRSTYAMVHSYMAAGLEIVQ